MPGRRGRQAGRKAPEQTGPLPECSARRPDRPVPVSAVCYVQCPCAPPCRLLRSGVPDARGRCPARVARYREQSRGEPRSPWCVPLCPCWQSLFCTSVRRGFFVSLVIHKYDESTFHCNPHSMSSVVFWYMSGLLTRAQACHLLSVVRINGCQGSNYRAQLYRVPSYRQRQAIMQRRF